MRRNVMNIVCVYLSILCSSYMTEHTVPEPPCSICKYFVYNPYAGTETDFESYIIQNIWIQPSCPGSGSVCWIRICDQNLDGDVDAQDFYAVVLGQTPGTGLDVDRDGSISDDQNENHYSYEERFFFN